MKIKYLVITFIALGLSGCASVPEKAVLNHSETPNFMAFKPSSSAARLYIHMGTYTVKGWLTSNLNEKGLSNGLLFVDNKEVGSVSNNPEFIVVDLPAGEHVAHWEPASDLDRSMTLPERFNLYLSNGDVKFLALNSTMHMAPMGGLLGALGNKLSTSVAVNNNSDALANRKPVSYFNIVSYTALVPPAPQQQNQSSDLISSKLRELDSLRKDGIITEEEFQAKKKQLLDKI